MAPRPRKPEAQLALPAVLPPPESPESPQPAKLWYPGGKNLDQSYAIALASCHELWHKGVKMIWHFQPHRYYKEVLALSTTGEEKLCAILDSHSHEKPSALQLDALEDAPPTERPQLAITQGEKLATDDVNDASDSFHEAFIV